MSWHFRVKFGQKKSIREYNNRTVYYCFNNLFLEDFGSPDLNLPPITIDDIRHHYRRPCCTPDMITSTNSVASENSVSNLTAPSDSPYLLFQPSDDPNHRHYMKKDDPYHGRVEIG